LSRSIFGSGRRAQFNAEDRPRAKKLVPLLLNLRGSEVVSIYLSGSYSKYNPKKPAASSDIDLYIFVKTNDPTFVWRESKNLDWAMRRLLGRDYHLFIVNEKLEQAITDGMEEL